MIDKLMKKYGYELVRQDKYGAVYEKFYEDFKYTQVLNVMHKASGDHIMQSYDKEVIKLENGKYLNEGAGVELPVLLLLWLKGIYLKIKYRW